MYKKPGFTLVELLVVIVIIGLLTSLATTSYLNAQRTSRDSARKIKVNSLSTAIESYYRVNQKFPGQNAVINGVTGTPYLPAQDYLDTTTGCEVYDSSTQGFVYYYYPTKLDPTATPPQQSCSTRNAGAIKTDGHYSFNPNDYKPYPNWIPGIGSYINPTPVESRYQGLAGSDTAVYSLGQDPLTAGVGSERTFVYRKLLGGYMIYTMLENNSDRDAVQAPYPRAFTDAPTYPNGTTISVYGPNVYMIRK